MILLYVLHPENPDLDNDGVIDSILVSRSYNGDEWTGSVSLPSEFYGKTLKINISLAIDQRSNQMVPNLFIKHQKPLLL